MRELISCSMVSLILCLSLTSTWAQDAKKPILVKIISKTGGWYVGELLEESTKGLKIMELKSGKERMIETFEIKSVSKDISDATAIRYSNLQSVVAWKISKMLAKPPLTGKIAKITPTVVYLNIGSDKGLAMDQVLIVYREEGKIVDPDTGKVIASERAKVAALKVVEVKGAYAKAKMTGSLETKLQIGDQVESVPVKTLIAVIPLADNNGNKSAVGDKIAEDLTTALVNKEVPVVERTLLSKAILELALQQSFLFEAKGAQKLGKQLGASAVLTGKIVRVGRSAKAYVRLIDVATGEILLASTESVSGSVGGGSGASASTTGGTTAGGGATRPGGTSKGGVKMYGLGSRMPAFLQSNATALGVKGGGIRTGGYSGRNFIKTKMSDLLKRDFRFELVITVTTTDNICFVGIGEAYQKRGGRDEPTNSVNFRIHPPNIANGQINLSKAGAGGEPIGKIKKTGTHRIVIEKSGSTVKFLIDVDNDGPSDDDIQRTIPDIKAYAPFLHNKNMYLFFGGAVTFKQVGLKISR